MQLKIELTDQEKQEMLAEAIRPGDHFLSKYPKIDRIRHVLKIKVRDLIEKTLNDKAKELANEE